MKTCLNEIPMSLVHAAAGRALAAAPADSIRAALAEVLRARAPRPPSVKPPRRAHSEDDRIRQLRRICRLASRVFGEPYHLDHIWPKSRGGLHRAQNLRPVPARLNLRKHAAFDERLVLDRAAVARALVGIIRRARAVARATAEVAT